MLDAKRYFTEGTFISTSLPEMRLRFPEDYHYLGKTRFILYGKAEVDRHHFVRLNADGSLRQLVVLHFESYLPDIPYTFNYGIPKPPDDAGPDFRYTPEMARLGGEDYIHNTWFFDAEADVRENPGAEGAHMAALLEGHGITRPGALQMSRYVRVVGEDRKSELILFYMEPLDETGYRIEDFVEGRAEAQAVDELSAALARRSYALFAGAIEG